MSSSFMDHPAFCTIVKLLHSLSNRPKSAEELLCQAGAELNKITDLLNDMKKKIDIKTNTELQTLYTYYRRYNGDYLSLVAEYGMEIPPLKPGDDISKQPLPVRGKRKAFRKSSREKSQELLSRCERLGLSTQAASNKVKLMSFEVLVESPPHLPSNDSSGSSSSGESSACSPLSMEPARSVLNHRHSIPSKVDPFADPLRSS